MHIELHELNNMMMNMAMIGVANYIKTFNCEADELTQREAGKFLKVLGHKPAKLTELEELKLIKGQRKGAALNSPVYYSRAEILSALNTKELLTVINR